MSLDIVIRNGHVMDGTGNPWFHADVGVEDGMVAAVGNLKGMDAKKVIDAKGMIVAPGFIDIHSHSDVPILVDRRGLSKIRQGVTTEVVGNCGSSAAPVNDSVREYREKYGRSSVPDDFHITWGTMAEYMDEVDKGAALNIAPLIGHGTVRQDIMGYENREPTAAELEEMRRLVAEAMMDGAWGMSTGLIYPPSVYGKAPEITELAKVVAQYGGLYFSHIRGEGETLLDAVKEACEIGLNSGAPVQIAHFKASGRPSWGKTKLSLAMVEDYRDRGVDVTFDQYPYIASSTGLTALLPHWAHEGGADRMLERLRDPETRQRLREESRLNYSWDEVMVTKAKNNPQYNGLNLQQISESMMDGAWGMSTGLIYPPGVYGKAPEITELAKVVAQYGGLYFSHIRGEGETLLDAVKEACEIGLNSGAPVEIAHFKASGRPSWGKTKLSLAMVEDYRDRGVDVTFDQYPYIASSTGLTALLPHWAHEGGADRMLERLRDPETRQRLREESRLNYGWDEVMVTKAKNNPQYNGLNLQQISESMGKDPYDAMFDLLIAENTQVQSVMFGLNEEDVVRVMRSPIGMVGSDASAICPEGVWADSKPHPRAYGTFPRVLGKYVREGVISLQEAVRKMTGAPAQRMGFKDRGLLKEGYKADITVFDPATVRDEATFTDPQRYASGIPYVIVNGVLVVEEEKYTGALPGKALRKPV